MKIFLIVLVLILSIKISRPQEYDDENSDENDSNSADVEEDTNRLTTALYNNQNKIGSHITDPFNHSKTGTDKRIIKQLFSDSIAASYSLYNFTEKLSKSCCGITCYC
jgi:hypothetical protein